MGRRAKLIWNAAAPAAASAILFTLAFAPFSWWPAGCVCLLPWLSSLRSCTKKAAAFSGCVFATGFLLTQMLWMPLFVGRWTGSRLTGWTPWMACLPIAWLIFGWMSVCMWRAYKLGGGKWAVVLVPLVWAGFEVFRSYMPVLAYPWSLLGGSFWSVPFASQSAFLGTVYLVSGLLVALQVALIDARERRWMPLVYVLAVATALNLGGWTLKAIRQPRTITAWIAQPGVDMAFMEEERRQTLLGDYLLSSTRQYRLAVPDERRASEPMVFPEGLGKLQNDQMTMGGKVVPTDLPILMGCDRYGDHLYQSAAAYDKGWQTHDKIRLVVFGEYVPGRNVIPFLDRFQLPNGDFEPGDHPKLLHVGNQLIGPVLCYEALFQNIARDQAENGAEWLAIMSIDDWYEGTAAPEQLWTAAVWRAIETGLPVVRSASTGISVAIDGYGRLVSRLPRNQPALERVTVQGFRGGPPLMQRLFPMSGLAAFLVIAAIGVLKRKSEKGT